MKKETDFKYRTKIGYNHLGRPVYIVHNDEPKEEAADIKESDGNMFDAALVDLMIDNDEESKSLLDKIKRRIRRVKHKEYQYNTIVVYKDGDLWIAYDPNNCIKKDGNIAHYDAISSTNAIYSFTAALEKK